MNGYEELANAIVLKAVADWRMGNEWEKVTIERFFHSAWFACLTSLDPELLITNLRKELN